MITRMLYMLDAALLGWQGVTLFRYDAANGDLSRITGYSATGQAFAFYEVFAVVGSGSYWLPVTPNNAIPSSWLSSSFGGVEELDVLSGSPGIWTSAAGQAVMRPAKALFWMPETVIAENQSYMPARSEGGISGAFPELAPPGPQVASPTTGSVQVSLGKGSAVRISAQSLAVTPTSTPTQVRHGR